MSANRAKDTKPELLLRKALWQAGARGYRLHYNRVPGRPDISFVSKKVAIFVNGCYWHRWHEPATVDFGLFQNDDYPGCEVDQLREIEMEFKVLLTVELDENKYAEAHGFPPSETADNFPKEFALLGDALTWHVKHSQVLGTENDRYPDVIRTILNRPRNGSGGGIPLTRGEVAMLFLDGHAGDAPDLLDVRSQGYGDDDLWDGLTVSDVLEDPDTAFVWTKWEPLELWH